MGYYKRSAYRNCRNQLPFFDSTLEGQVFPDRNGLCVAGATHCTKMLENYCHSINTRFCAFHRVPANFSKDFWTPTGLFRFKRLAVTTRKKRKICYKPFDFFLSEFETKKLGGAYQRPQGGGRGGGGRWSGWWRKVVKWRTWSKMERTFVCFAKQNTHHKLIFSFCGAKARKPWMSIWHH